MIRSRSTTSIRLAAAGIAGLIGVSAVLGQLASVPGPSMTWTTVDGGGGKSTAEVADGSLELIGTIGQPDAAVDGPLYGGGIYAFQPGFWNDHALGSNIPCPADITGDGFINVSDLLIVIGTWGQPAGQGDVNHDGLVNVSDLLIVIGAWGTCPF